MDFFSLFNKKPSSGAVARDRLKLVLTYDRANCSTQLLEMIKADIMKVISNYMEFDETETEVQITQTTTDRNDNVPVLYVNIPIKNMRKVRT